MRRIISLAVGLILLFALAAPQTAYAWGDSDGGRPSYTTDEISNDALGDTITLNSISDNPNIGGDEKNFVGAKRVDSADTAWNADTIPAEDGERYFIRMYIHNNNPGGYDALAEDVSVRFDIAEGSGIEVEVQGFINSSNASPAEYYDNVNFTSDTAFHLEYVSGSAFIENNGIAADGGIGLSDEVVQGEGGVLIGFDGLDGNLPGGYQYAAYIGIEVEVVYDYSFTSETLVRLAGDDNAEWQKEITAEVGDEVEFQIYYQNIEASQVTDVMIRDSLPTNLEYVDGTAIIYNSTHPSGTAVDDGAELFAEGINIGNFASEANAYLRFSAKVVDEDLECGENTLVNWGQIGVGSATQQEYARVVVRNDSLPILLGVIFMIAAIIFGVIFLVLRIKIYRQKRSRK